MAISFGPLRLRVIAGQIEEKGGQVLAVLNPDATPSMMDSFTTFIEDCAEYGATDEVIETLFPSKETATDTDQGTAVVVGMSLQEQADADYAAFLEAEASRNSYDALAAKINRKTKWFTVNTVQVLQIIREHFNIDSGANDVRHNTENADERSYRLAHENGEINTFSDDL